MDPPPCTVHFSVSIRPTCGAPETSTRPGWGAAGEIPRASRTRASRLIPTDYLSPTWWVFMAYRLNTDGNRIAASPSEQRVTKLHRLGRLHKSEVAVDTKMIMKLAGSQADGVRLDAPPVQPPWPATGTSCAAAQLLGNDRHESYITAIESTPVGNITKIARN